MEYDVIMRVFFIAQFCFTCVVGIQRMWFIRHCDKTVGVLNDDGSDQDPCCTDPGYMRSAHWSVYFTKYLTPQAIVTMYAGNYKLKDDSEFCTVPNMYYDQPYPTPNKHLRTTVRTDDGGCGGSKHPAHPAPPTLTLPTPPTPPPSQVDTKVCHRSQRMVLTANLLRYHLTDAVGSISMNTDFCTGEYHEMMTHMHAAHKYATDTITVWEHYALITLLQDQGLSIPGWPHDPIGSTFNLIFMVDTTTSEWYYDCYIYETDEIMCPQFITTYYGNAKTIRDYYHNKTLSTITSDETEQYVVQHWVKITIIVVLSLMVGLLVCDRFVYRCCQRSRYRYTTVESQPLNSHSSNVAVSFRPPKTTYGSPLTTSYQVN